LRKGEVFHNGEDLNADVPVIGLYLNMVGAFTRYIVEDTDPPATGKDGPENLRVANAIIESSQTGKAAKIR
jgi:predicted dehydrogenase